MSGGPQNIFIGLRQLDSEIIRRRDEDGGQRGVVLSINTGDEESVRCPALIRGQRTARTVLPPRERVASHYWGVAYENSTATAACWHCNPATGRLNSGLTADSVHWLNWSLPVSMSKTTRNASDFGRPRNVDVMVFSVKPCSETTTDIALWSTEFISYLGRGTAFGGVCV